MKKLPFFLSLFTAFIFFLNFSSVNAQTYFDIYFGNYSDGANVFICSSDSIRIIPPSGSTNVVWHLQNPGYPSVLHGDTLVLAGGYIGGVGCIYNGNSKNIYLFLDVPLTVPGFLPVDTICGIETRTLNAGNSSMSTSYLWSNGSTNYTITVGAGFYSVTVSNACGSVYDSTTIINYNPLKPDLGPDTSVCKGTTLVLTPGTGYSNYLWMAPSNNFPYFTPVGTDSTISVTYDLATPYWGFNSGPLYISTTNPGSGCEDKDTIIITFLLPPIHTICYVECDTATQKNNVIWSTPPTSASAINIYREVSTNVWDLIGNVPATQTHFIDTTSNPQNMSYSYEISVIDTCNNEGQKSNNHKTITLLSAYDQPTNTYGFTWSAYAGLVVPNYLLYGLNAAGDATQIASVPGNTFFYNYTNPLPAYVKYFVAFISPSCSNKTDYLVKSNLVNSVPLAIDELQATEMKIYPNPATYALHIESAYEYAEFFDASGKCTGRYDNKQSIDVSLWPKGFYFIKIVTNTHVMAGKIIVE